MSESTVRRWRDELITLRAAQAPRLDRALRKVVERGGEVVLIDGTLIRTRRRTGKADRRERLRAVPDARPFCICANDWPQLHSEGNHWS
ncbi:hypothetical protein ACFC08_04765 [Streptomyces sp. NPDC056112]|uniref:hypothetical protein n=1 Tax=unclassified Streptomyces TaxID=2593676 RepID=UPI0024809823|nr:hypothetical protein [Streptomyces sp. HYC2]